MSIESEPDAEISPFKGKTGMRRICNALLYSFDGLASAYRHESAFRQELLLAAVLIPVALLLPVSWTQKAILCASVILVLVVELMNSAVEATVDLVTIEQNSLAKRAKDAGSAAVFLSLCLGGLAWLLILVDRFS